MSVPQPGSVIIMPPSRPPDRKPSANSSRHKAGAKRRTGSVKSETTMPSDNASSTER